MPKVCISNCTVAKGLCPWQMSRGSSDSKDLPPNELLTTMVRVNHGLGRQDTGQWSLRLEMYTKLHWVNLHWTPAIIVMPIGLSPTHNLEHCLQPKTAEKRGCKYIQQVASVAPLQLEDNWWKVAFLHLLHHPLQWKVSFLEWTCNELRIISSYRTVHTDFYWHYFWKVLTTLQLLV